MEDRARAEQTSIASTPCLQGKANQLFLKTGVRDCFISLICF